MMRLFQSALYARTEASFLQCKEDIFNDAIGELYPQRLKHLRESYFKTTQRIISWALYVRYTEQLPTHENNTNNYVETSFWETKDNQFDRIKCFNLPDLLSVLMDHSSSYKTKLTDIGNNRVSYYKYSKSKYAG